MRNADWHPFGCGARVHRKDDPRHIGTTISIKHSAFVHVCWDGDPQIHDHDIPIDDLVKAPKDSNYYLDKVMAELVRLCGVARVRAALRKHGG